MATMHMLQNAEIHIDETATNDTGKKHRLKTVCVKLLCLAGGILLIYLAFKMLGTMLRFLLDLLTGSVKQLRLMPGWMQWAASLGNRISSCSIDVNFRSGGTFASMGLIRSLLAIIWVFVKLLFGFIINVFMFLLGRVVALLPVLLVLAIGGVGIYLLIQTLVYTADETARSAASKDNQRRIHERGKEGEQIAMKELQKLPDEYHVFGNLQFEYPNANGEPRPGEADFLVVGATGLHLIEIKHWTGSISDGSSDKMVYHTKTDGTGIEEKSPFYQAMSNSGKLGRQVRHFAKINARIHANVLFTDDRLSIDMQIPEGCSSYRIGDELQYQSLTKAICQENDSMLQPNEVKQIVETIYQKIWKPEFSQEVLQYMGETD